MTARVAASSWKPPRPGGLRYRVLERPNDRFGFAASRHRSGRFQVTWRLRRLAISRNSGTRRPPVAERTPRELLKEAPSAASSGSARPGQGGMPGVTDRGQGELSVAGSLRDLQLDDHVPVRVDRVPDLDRLRTDVGDPDDRDPGLPGARHGRGVRLMLAGFLHGIAKTRPGASEKGSRTPLAGPRPGVAWRRRSTAASTGSARSPR
jgi:hypothetical protein